MIPSKYHQNGCIFHGYVSLPECSMFIIKFLTTLGKSSHDERNILKPSGLQGRGAQGSYNKKKKSKEFLPTPPYVPSLVKRIVILWLSWLLEVFFPIPLLLLIKAGVITTRLSLSVGNFHIKISSALIISTPQKWSNQIIHGTFVYLPTSLP